MGRQHKRSNSSDDWCGHRRSRMFLVVVAQPGAQDIDAWRSDVNTLSAVVRKRGKRVTAIESSDTDYVSHIVAGWIVWGSICIGTCVTACGDKKYARLIRLADYVFKRPGSLRRSPAGIDHPNINPSSFAVDGIIERFDCGSCGAKPTGVHKLQRHDFNFPIDSRDADGISTFRPDDARAVGAVAVLVKWITVVLVRVVAMNVVDHAEVTISILLDIRWPGPNIVH